MENPGVSEHARAEHVFVCYSHADADRTQDLLEWLAAESIGVWYDDGIRPGEEWTAEIANAIESASHLLFLATARSVQSRHCRNEVHFAINHGKRVITLYLEDVRLPVGLELELALQQAIPAFADGTRYRERLLRALGPVANRVPAESRHAPANDVRSPSPSGASSGQIFAVAVLPLRNLASAADGDYFSDGVSEEILNRLAQVGGLRVIARGSSFAFKGQDIDVRQIGRRLGARFVLDGSGRRAANRVRISAQLNDCEDGLQLWSGRFDGELEDIFTLQDRMADAVLDGLRDSGTLPMTTPSSVPARSAATGQIAAHDAVLRGLDARRRMDFQGAVAHFERAVQHDPHYSDGYAQLAEVCLDAFAAYQGQLLAQGEFLPKAVEAAHRGFQLDPGSEQANRVMSMTRQFSSEWSAAQRFGLRALHINPNNPRNSLQFAQLLRTTSRAEQALDYLKWAQALDPLHDHSPMLEWILIDTRRFAEARQLCTAHIERRSDGPDEQYIQLACTFGGEGDFEQVVYWQSHPNFPLPAIAFSDTDASRLRDAHRSAGRRGYFDEYLQWVLRMKQRGGTFVLDTFLTWAYGELGYLEEAFVALDLVAKGSFIPQQYFYDPLRDDPRWTAFLARRGLEPAAISLLDDDARQLKAQLGLAEPWRSDS